MKKKVLIVIILTLISLIIINETKEIIVRLSNKQDVEDIKTVDILKNKKQSIAVMVQQDDNTWRAAENRNAWPSSSNYGFAGSKCYDGNGALVESSDIIKFDLNTYIATINTTNSIYCTLYFAKGRNALELLQEKGKTTFASGNLTAVDGLYRFKGTSAQVLNNYICFGTLEESTCTTNELGNYMYRIIGLTSAADSEIGLKANQLKIIRAVPSNTSQQWGSSKNDNSPWGSSSAKTYLNTTFLNTIKGLADGTYWDSMISQHGWYITDQTNTPGSIEPKTTKLVGDENNRIGLMYATDYINANGASTSNWLFITNGWNGNKTKEEWTMSRIGSFADGTYVYNVATNGNLVSNYVSDPWTIRPVFYLQSGVNLTGEGTKDHPFIISGVMPQD